MYPTFATTYRTMRANVATTMARGNTRCGSFVSPAENVTYCHPSYAHSTPIIAVPAPVNTLGPTLAGHSGPGLRQPCPIAMSARLNTNSAPTFADVAQFSTVALPRVPRTFTSVMTMITAIEMSFATSGVTGRICPKYVEKATASVATEPLAITKKLAHP